MKRPIEILLVEDNATDVYMTQEALALLSIPHNLHVVGNGVIAIDFLMKKSEYKTAPVPDLILLDLNMPLKSGMEVLQEINEDSELKRIPVVVLTTSSADDDIINSYKLNANCYIIKPLEFKRFIEIVESIYKFWVGIVTLPSKIAD